MAIPPTAAKLGRTLDPTDVKEIVLNYASTLQAGEQIDTYQLVLSAQSVALGMEILTGGGRSPEIINNGTAIRIWPAIDIAEQDNAAFDGTGVALDVLATVVTTATPSRTDQQTFLVPWAQR